MAEHEEVVQWERRGAVGIITVNRPKALNALNTAVLDGLHDLLERHGDGDGLRAIVLTGAGRAFVAGADISAMQNLKPTEAESFAKRGQDLGVRITELAVPVIAAVNGFALGGGCELAMSCDIVLAGPKAKFGQPEVKLGVIPGFGGTQRLLRRVGLTTAMDLCLTGRMVDAEEAVRMGLVARAVTGDVLEAAIEVAHTIAEMGPVAIRLAKRALNENADCDLATGLAAERTLFALCFATSDQAEGMKAFLERRSAQFTGQ